MTNTEAVKYLLFTDEQKTTKGIEELFDYTIQSYSDEMEMFSLTIADKSSDEFIGSVGVAPDFQDDANCVQIYWSLLPEFWSKGYATEATNILIKYLLQQEKVNKIKAYSHPNNDRSLKVAKKVGMEDLGISFIEAIGLESRCFVITDED